jgi:mannose-1-phosphate guanylyltransferase
MGWADPGTLYALKEALVGETGKNYTQGNVINKDTEDSLIINEENNKLVATLGLDKVVVVNTEDVLLIAPKEKVLDISELLSEIKEDEKLKKYT